MNSTNSKKLFMIAGEPSGDLHGSNLISELLKQSPGMQIVGMGGELMEQAGAKLWHKIGELSVLGFTEVIKKLPRYRKLFLELTAKLDSERPDAVVLIDFPGFNIRFAREAKKRNIPVIYYISPQVWAWAKGRVKTIKKFVNKILVFFEFEKDLYQQHGVDSIFIGHPLIDSVKPTMSKEHAFKTFGLNPRLKTIACLPGSRQTEIKKVLPVMLAAARLIRDQFKEIQFILIRSPIIETDVFQNLIKGFKYPVIIVDKNRYDAVNCCDLALVASGTATLETAILKKPMILVYKVAFLTWLLARMLIKIPYIGLVNIVAGEKIVPEFIQFGAHPKKISRLCIDILNSPKKAALMESQLARVKKKLGLGGASSRAAKEIISFLNRYHTNPCGVG